MSERPKARKDGLLIEAVDDEVLVYDTERHRAHALNRSAAEIWQRCDGVATPAQIAERLSDARHAPVTEEFVRYGLERLHEFHLLEPESVGGPRPSRRELIRAGGLAVLALPVITSIVAPIAAEAQSGGVTGPTGATG